MPYRVHFGIEWIDAGREPRNLPDPRYPLGIDVDTSNGAESCMTPVPYPAKRCGMYVVTCRTCGLRTSVTTAGRPDDPRSLRVACKIARHYREALMSVGGRIIEMRDMTLTDSESPGWSKFVTRLWVVDRNGDETCVFAEPADVMPTLGDEVWWQAGQIFFDHDRHTLRKISYSFSAPTEGEAAP